MGRIGKLLKKAFAHENVLKIQFKINKSKKKGTFFLKTRNIASDILMLNYPRLGPETL